MNLNQKIKYYAAWVSYISTVFGRVVDIINDIPIPKKETANDTNNKTYVEK